MSEPNDPRTDAERDDALTPTIYRDLRAIAARVMAAERSSHTLSPTALVHEAYLRFSSQDSSATLPRAHYLSLAARMMRRVLIDHERRRRAARRDAGREVLEGTQVALEQGDVDLLALEGALSKFEGVDPRAARLVELRFFGGLTFEEAAGELDVSVPTAKRDWSVARAWLQRALRDD
ncbi:MAG: ECF-type sigma factor [Planctomycetota bacterium]